jgi:glycosyltransferase involved in cell wall biosynthesis
MIEAMACGAPVLALRGGAVEEVVADGVGGYICSDVDDMAARTKDAAGLKPADIRAYVEQNFSIERMASQYAELFREVATARELFPARAAVSDADNFAGENSIVA